MNRIRKSNSKKGHKFGSAVADGLIAGMQSLLHELTTDTLDNKRIHIVNLQSPLDASGVREAREALGLSQPHFADFIGASASTVRAWESGTKTPTPIAQRFLQAIRSDPAYWRKKLLPHIHQKV